MKVVISHVAAYLWLMRHANPCHAGERISRASLVGASAPDAARTRKLQWYLDLEDVPLDVLVTDSRQRRRNRYLHSHLCKGPLPSGSLIPIARDRCSTTQGHRMPASVLKNNRFERVNYCMQQTPLYEHFYTCISAGQDETGGTGRRPANSGRSKQ